MFEQKAEEIANKKLCSKRICYNHCNFNSPKHHRCGEWHRCYESAKEGAEFGFQECAKARLNVTTISDCPIKDEWHYVKNRDFPVKEDYYVIACHSATGNFTDRCQWLNNEWWVADGEAKYFINENVYAWKEKPEPPEEI